MELYSPEFPNPALSMTQMGLDQFCYMYYCSRNIIAASDKSISFVTFDALISD